MGREFKFRGLCKGQWVYGSLVSSQYPTHQNTEQIYNESGFNIVDSKTVGQYTGLKDKNGKDIYGGDRLKRRIMDNSMDWIDMTCEVRWMKWCYGLYIHDKYITVLDTATANSCEVVGHIHEQLNKG